jgi:hypothetical protein
LSICSFPDAPDEVLVAEMRGLLFSPPPAALSIDPGLKWDAVAHHEAGHTAIALLLRRPFVYAHIGPSAIREGGRSGLCYGRDVITTRHAALDWVIAAWSGFVAQSIHATRREWQFARDDVARIVECTRATGIPPEETIPLLRVAVALVIAHWPAVERISRLLRSGEKVSRRMVRGAFEAEMGSLATCRRRMGLAP